MSRFTGRVWLLLLGLFMLGACSAINRYPTEGTMVLPEPGAPVHVVRDEKGMAYIHAENQDDALFALGYATAQDRLFQMTLTRLFAEGRISELVGEKGRALDIRHRTLGFYRLAQTHARLLETDTRRFFQRYIDGVNAYIRTGADNFPLEFKLSKISPEPWRIADSLAILYFMSWDTSANIKTEIVAQLLVDHLGDQKAREIFPLNINPDDEAPRPAALPPSASALVGIAMDEKLRGLLEDGSHALGSNNWVVAGSMSASGKPVVCNDPHLDTRILPGPWYPAGFFTLAHRIVGVHIPGLPLMPIFRNQYVAVGITNAYGDMQDLYVETVDPDNPEHYLEGKRSIAFGIIKETLRIRDKSADGGFREEPVVVRHTRRGPVVSGVLKGLDTHKVMSLRWAPVESMQPTLGICELIHATSVADVRHALTGTSTIMLNFVFADTAGNIGWHVSGRLPIRSTGDGTVPLVVADETDNWVGFVPFAQMPQAANPNREWIGTCNHHTVARDYPFYFSSYQSPSYRYRRLEQLLDTPGRKNVDDHWRFQRDTANLLAETLVPLMVDVLEKSPETRTMATLLKQWDRHDEKDSAGATVFHAIYERFAWLTVVDELGEELAATMLGVWYFWQERFQQMVLANGLDHWFDDTNTADAVEGKREILTRAAIQARDTLAATMGSDPGNWRWGRVHRHTFVSPIRREGFGKGLLGGGSHPADGSLETLYRGLYNYNDPYDVTVSAALRMVADLGDDEKVLAVLSGGVAGRVFHPHATDQLEEYMNGDKMYWWFSDNEIRKHAQSDLMLTPPLQ